MMLIGKLFAAEVRRAKGKPERRQQLRARYGARVLAVIERMLVEHLPMRRAVESPRQGIAVHQRTVAQAGVHEIVSYRGSARTLGADAVKIGHDCGVALSNSTASPQSDVNIRRLSCPTPGTSTTLCARSDGCLFFR